MNTSFALATETAAKPETLTDLLSRSAQEFMQLHAAIKALSPQTGIAVPSLVKCATACGLSLDEGFTPIMNMLASNAIFGALGMTKAVQAGVEVGGGLAKDKFNQTAQKNAPGFQMDAKKRMQLVQSQTTKQKRLADLMNEIKMLNDMKAMGVTSVVRLNSGDFADVSHTANLNSKPTAPNRATFKPEFAPRKAFALPTPRMAA